MPICARRKALPQAVWVRVKEQTVSEHLETVHVALGDRSYDILIGGGLLAECGRLIEPLAPGCRCVIVTDSHVEPLYGPVVREALDQQGIAHQTLVCAPGEGSKSLAVFSEQMDRLLALKMERNDVLLALGGGVVGDLSGFLAASMRRGMGFVQLPTSLLAQVDSSVGGKTGINSSHGKNLIGAFYQPKLVLADIDTLGTLSRREFAAGYAEVAKYGLIDRPDFFAWLDSNHDAIFKRGPELIAAVAESCRAKAEVVAADEKEQGKRALLNLGHTFGHALEAATGYDSERLVHGEGVAIGICMAHRFSNRMNLCSSDDVERVVQHFSKVGLPTSPSQIPGGVGDAEALMGFIAQDKKVKRGALTFILTRGVGQSFVADDVPPSEVLSFLKEHA